MFSRGTKVWLFLLALCVALLLLGEHFGGRTGLFIGFLLAVGLNTLVFFLGESRILSKFDHRPLKGRDGWGVLSTVDKLSKSLQMTPPTVFLIDSATVTAFSIGFSVRRPCLCLTRGLLERLSREELEAVIAQQLCHVRRVDSFGFGVTSVIANSLMELGQLLDRFWPMNFFFGKGQQPFLTLLSPLGWIIIRSVVSPSTYFENDRQAAELLGDRHRLSETLWRLDSLAQARPMDVPPCTSHLFIVNPEGVRQRNPFLRSHPALPQRLQQLIGTPTI